MSAILSVAHTPPTQVEVGSTVTDAVNAMVQSKVGAVAITRDQELRGIFTERDLMTKVVGQGLDPSATPIEEVMTRDVESLTPDCTLGRAFRVMTSEHFRHLPICDESRKVLGILSIRDVLYNHVETLADELDSLESYLSADGPGG